MLGYLATMREDTPVVERVVAADVPTIWSVLENGWLYPSWVVGASRMRAVDAGWPQPGSRLHHSVGNWPLLLDDRTEVLECDPSRMLRLKAHAWPGGAAQVLIELEPEPSGASTTVRMREDAVDGPATLVPRLLRQAGMIPRNREALRRLAFLAEGRAAS